MVSRPRTPRVVTVASWIAVSVLTGVLAVQRYTAAMAGEVGIDLATWLDAAGEARRGGNPYDVGAYTYTPLMAWLLAPFADKSWNGVWTAVSLVSGLAAIAFVIATHRRQLPQWRAPLVVAVAVVSLLYSHVWSPSCSGASSA
jgi:hypothetical protein